MSESAEQLKNKGNACYRVKDYEQAIDWYSKALDKDPKNHALYTNRAAAYLGSKDFMKAIEDCERSVQYKPDWRKGYYRSASAYSSLGLFDDAKQVCQKGLKALPGVTIQNDPEKNE